MAIISEVEHILGDSTPSTFEKYVEIYGDTAIRAMNGIGINLLGAWRQVTGPIGRDLMLSSFESMAELEDYLPKLMEHEALLEGLPRLMGLGFTIDEAARYGRTLPFADERRLLQGTENLGVSPRSYRLIRRRADSDGMEAAIGKLSDLADALEAAGSWKLFTAYLTTVGDRRELTEIWIVDDFTSGWYPQAAPLEVLAALDAVTLDSSVQLLEPLPYSKAR